MTFDPAARVQDYLVFGEFGYVNPSISDSSTFTFLSRARMEEVFEHEIEAFSCTRDTGTRRTRSSPRPWPGWRTASRHR